MQIKSVHFVQDSFRKADIQLKLVRKKKYMLNNIENSGIVGILGGGGWSSGLFLCLLLFFRYSLITKGNLLGQKS